MRCRCSSAPPPRARSRPRSRSEMRRRLDTSACTTSSSSTHVGHNRHLSPEERRSHHVRRERGEPPGVGVQPQHRGASSSARLAGDDAQLGEPASTSPCGAGVRKRRKINQRRLAERGGSAHRVDPERLGVVRLPLRPYPKSTPSQDARETSASSTSAGVRAASHSRRSRQLKASRIQFARWRPVGSETGLLARWCSRTWCASCSISWLVKPAAAAWAMF